MFKKSRRNIVASIMSILIVLWAGTLGVIYASSYIELSGQNREMLKIHAEMFDLKQPPGKPGLRKPMPDKRPNKADSPAFKLTTFYTVAMGYDGQVLEINNGQPTVHSNEKLQTLAHDIATGKNAFGTKDNLMFYFADKGGYLLVSFMDNTVIHESMNTLFRYTLLFGGVAIVLFFFVAVFLAKKIVQPLEESYQKQKQFISDAGHELKTPVSIVSANAELLAREIGDNPWLANIQYENERMGTLVAQLLELARTENITLQTERIDFSRLVEGEALPFESIAFEKGLLLHCDIADNIAVEGNRAQLKQLVSILLDNAVRHSTGGNEVRLNLAKGHGYAELSVINSGKEIPLEQREKLFERFYRMDAARNSDDKHYGLGLAIAKAIVASHKGSIEVLCYDGLVEFRVQIPMR